MRSGELGAEIEYVHHEGYPPLCIIGAELKGNEITLKGNVSTQYISALLMIGPALKDGLTLHLSGEIISRPYIKSYIATDAGLWSQSRMDFSQ